MGLETGTYIDSLNSANPLGSDPKSAGDDHIRLLKSTIKATFPNITGALTATHTQLNFVTGVTSAIQTQLDGKQAAGSYQPLDDQLTTLAGITAQQATDLAAVSTFMGTVLDDADAATARATLGGVNPVGEVAYFAMATAPSGWLAANGAAISRTTYAALFAAIGTTFGVGDGAATFNLPDLRGEFIRGFDDGRGVDSARVFGSAQADELKSHAHSVPINDVAGAGSAAKTTSFGGSGLNTGSSGGSETRPRNIALLACIKY